MIKKLLNRLKLDGVVAVVFVLAAAAAYAETLTFRPAAAMWPQAVILAFGVLSLAVVVQRLLFPGKDET